MKRTELTIGATRYILETTTAELRSLYLHNSNGCIYIGTWDREEFEQAAARVYQNNAGLSGEHYESGVNASW